MEALRRWLADNEFTQKAFGERIGVSQATVSDYLNGVIEPSFSTLRKMHRITGLSFDDLIGRHKQNGGGSERRAAPG